MTVQEAIKNLKELKKVNEDLMKQAIFCNSHSQEHLKNEVQSLEMAMEVLKKQPTAFDAEKVIEQLEEQHNINRYEHHNDEWNVGIEQAIEIVRGG